MTNKISFITGNSGKYSDAIEVFSNSGIELEQLSLDTPEIQSYDAEEIAKYSAEFISKTCDKPFFLMDRSFHINGLNGFPGPFVKYINKWLNENQIEKLLMGVNNTEAKWVTAIACYIPGKEIKTFIGNNQGSISFNSKGVEGYMIDKIFIPNGSNKTLAQMNQEERTSFWNSCNCWNELINYLQSN